MEIEQYYDKIYRYCYFKVHNKALAEDLTQETFLRFLGADCEYPDRYLYTIARNLCIDEYRKNRPELTNYEDCTEELWIQNGFENTIVDKLSVKQALYELSDEDRELLILRYVNDEPMSEICKVTGLSRFAVYRRLKEAKSRLSTLLERGNDERFRDEKLAEELL